MKTNKNVIYKVKFADLKERYNFSDNLNDEIQKRINRTNRINNPSRRSLERRSLELQQAYIFVKQLDVNVIKQLETVFDNLKTVRKEVSICWDYKRLLKAEKQVDRVLANYRLLDHFRKYNDTLIAVITGYKFY